MCILIAFLHHLWWRKKSIFIKINFLLAEDSFSRQNKTTPLYFMIIWMRTHVMQVSLIKQLILFVLLFQLIKISSYLTIQWLVQPTWPSSALPSALTVTRKSLSTQGKPLLPKNRLLFLNWIRQHSINSKVLKCAMKFAAYIPTAASEKRLPVLIWLSGLTCNEQNFITKSGFQRYASECQIIVVAPDTSPSKGKLRAQNEFCVFKLT